MYKTILVDVDDTAGSRRRIDVAARLALLHNAHLVGVAATGLSPYYFPVGGFDPGLSAASFPLEKLQATADSALDKFDAAVRLAGVSTFERRRIDDEAGPGISMQARYADLVVLGRGGADAPLPVRAGTLEHILLHCARPVLVVPPAGVDGELGKRIVVAWNGSVDAVRAITSAIPMLQRAAQVHLVVFNAASEVEVDGPEPGVDMALYLARHDVRVDVMAAEIASDPGAALLSHAADVGADLIVMGAYGHSRLREAIMGGATRTVLRSSRLPLWMAH
jgi:nucleotide-binding universal stress UspA family protein